MGTPEKNTSVEERVGLQHRVSIGIVSMTLGLLCLSLALALYIAPSGLASKLFILAPSAASVTASSATAVTLSWTAPGDDGNAGQAARYDIRYSTAPITASSFASATVASNPPAPQPAGTHESWTVTGLQPSTTYFFALKTVDTAGNTSDISNVPTAVTSSAPSACTPTYSCSGWSACTNGLITRTCTVTNGCSSNLDAPITQQACVPPPGGVGGSPANHVTKHVVLAGSGKGVTGTIRFIDPANSRVYREIRAFSTNDTNGVHVAVGDLNGDHKADIIAATSAPSNPLIRLFSDAGVYQTQFNPYPTLKKTGVTVGVGDVDGDGIDELITVPDNASGQVRIFKYSAKTKKFTTYAQFQALGTTYHGGFSMAIDDMDLNGTSDIVLAARQNSANINVYTMNGKTVKKLAAFRAFSISFKSGLVLATGDVNGDGRPEILAAAGVGYYADVKALTMTGKLIGHFLPGSTTFYGGVNLSALDVNGDGRDEVLSVTGSGGTVGLRIFRYSGTTKSFSKIRDSLVFPASMKKGAYLGSV